MRLLPNIILLLTSILTLTISTKTTAKNNWAVLVCSVSF